MTSKEALEKLFNDIKQFEEHFLGCICNDTKEEYNLIEKDLKILEILKNKLVDITILYFSTCIEVYNCGFANRPKFQLTQEEYNKIKEWLDK